MLTAAFWVSFILAVLAVSGAVAKLLTWETMTIWASVLINGTTALGFV